MAVTTKNQLIYTDKDILKYYTPTVEKLINSIKEDRTAPIILSMGQKIRADHSLDEQLEAIASPIFFMPYMKVHDFIYSLELYNNATEKIAKDSNIPFLQWHNELPGNSKYFHDARHFTSVGSKELGSILARELDKDTLLTKQLKLNGFSCTQEG